MSISTTGTGAPELRLISLPYLAYAKSFKVLPRVGSIKAIHINDVDTVPTAAKLGIVTIGGSSSINGLVSNVVMAWVSELASLVIMDGSAQFRDFVFAPSRPNAPPLKITSDFTLM